MDPTPQVAFVLYQVQHVIPLTARREQKRTKEALVKQVN